MSFRALFKLFICISIPVVYTSCGTPADVDETLTDSAGFTQQTKNATIQKIFASIPSQSETMEMLEGAGAKYNPKLLNPIEAVSKYSSLKARAINLGVYGIDLGVTSLFDQTQESMLYLRCTNKLASSLGISGAFDEKMTSRIDASSDNKDSLLAIISESYHNADNYLQENGQAGVSSLMVAGGWIEGLYISSQIASVTNNEAIIDKIAGEKETLGNVVSLLETYKKENEGTEDLLNGLTQLKAIYDAAIPAGAPVKLNPEQFKQVAEKAAEVRNKVILYL